MSAPEIKGYCPGALRPMMSGDGLVVRIRPFGGRLSPTQSSGIAILSETYGNGIIDLSSRANVQLRGVTTASHKPLIDGLRALDLIDTSEAIESRRNVIVSPFWETDDATKLLSEDLTTALSQPNAPAIPHKFGFAIDTGPTPVLQTASADIRLERDTESDLILVADGMTTGKSVTPEESIEEAMTLAHWFMANRTAENRMAKLLQTGTLPGFTTPRQTQTYHPKPGVTAQGPLVSFAFGQPTASTLGRLGAQSPLRITPWRLILVEGAQALPDIDGLITDPTDPLLRITACTGAPDCSQALNQPARLPAPSRRT